ncbi:hypothetical protein C1T17_15855 [Sphingobium sp. SCG-1]|uniref:hypothetical protein n=1 Tax=Sphingobium sp. SCG-1 TaxID=2072936 RepID=UPI000CD689D6|nr:hypothetical protein [Sphingobium sp. SCG-1]AUW59340.1 hypothetical protein C1T17_15855 [Sphingobium sp. SCG-1]
MSIADAQEVIVRLKKKLDRERRARSEAEQLIESKSLELFSANQRLAQVNGELEAQVESTLAYQHELHAQKVHLEETLSQLSGIVKTIDTSSASIAIVSPRRTS